MIGPVFDWFDDFDLLVKNETVRGTIGKTQGVKIASNPPPNAIRIKPNRDWVSSVFLSSFSTEFSSLTTSSKGAASSVSFLVATSFTGITLEYIPPSWTGLYSFQSPSWF